ncbi:MAG: PilZ domain-containing protein [Proteobacteria bacterium]|nr:PilZ domain-containing protein [Pseudomonadota bacterium]
MFWFGRKKSTELEPEKTADVPEVDVLLTDVSEDTVTLQTRRTLPLGVWLYMNVTSAAIENVRSTGIKVRLDETRKAGRSVNAYRGHLKNVTPTLLEWLCQIRDQGLPNAQNAPHYVYVHLDQRLERRSYRQFQVMSPDIPDYKAITTDVSRTGIRLQLSSELQVGSVVRLKLVFDDFNFDDVEVRGEVLWTMARERETWWAGIRFIDPSPHAREALDGYISFADGYKKKRFRGV